MRLKVSYYFLFLLGCLYSMIILLYSIIFIFGFMTSRQQSLDSDFVFVNIKEHCVVVLIGK